MIKQKKYIMLITIVIIVLITGFVSTANATIKQHTPELVQNSAEKHEELSGNVPVPDRTSAQDTVNEQENQQKQDTVLGGNIGIHGGSVPSFGSKWTWGCIGLSNADIEDFYNYITVGTSIIIQQ